MCVALELFPCVQVLHTRPWLRRSVFPAFRRDDSTARFQYFTMIILVTSWYPAAEGLECRRCIPSCLAWRPWQRAALWFCSLVVNVL